jgi:hypothetical protein
LFGTGGGVREPDSAFPEFNPLRFPPCACPRCRDDEDVEDAEDGGGGNEAGAGGEADAARDAALTDGDHAGADGDSVLLRRLRERVAEENRLRGSLRRTDPSSPAGA